MEKENQINAEKEFLLSLFSDFAASCLSYCVLRNYATLPESLGGSDLDLAVLPNEKDLAVTVVQRAAIKFGGSAIIDYTSSGRFIRILGCYKGKWWGAAIDLFWMMEYRGVEYISSADVVGRAVDYRDIKVARDDDAAVIALVKELLSNGKTRKTYFPDLADIYRDSGDATLHLMRQNFSHETITLMGSMLSEGRDDSASVTALSKRMRLDVFRAEAENKIECMLKNMVSRLRRLFKPAGFSIAVLGTDGSGKSTLIKKITPVLERAIHNELQYEHLRPNLLPALGVATGKREKGDGSPETNPHGQSPSGIAGSLVRLGYYATDYIFGYWFKVYPKLVKRPHICLFDRYYYDFIIDPRRMRINLPRWVMQTVMYAIPKPDLILCLGSDPEKIFARKPETSLEEVHRQTEELKVLCLTIDSAFWVDTGNTIEKSGHEMLSIIRGAMAGRYK